MVSVDEVVFKISKSFNQIFDDYKGMYVFGSCTDGQIHENEDLELAAIFDVEDKFKREQIWPVIGKIETELDVCIDLYPYTKESFKKDEEIYETVMTEGIFYNNKGVKDESNNNSFR